MNKIDPLQEQAAHQLGQVFNIVDAVLSNPDKYEHGKAPQRKKWIEARLALPIVQRVKELCVEVVEMDKAHRAGEKVDRELWDVKQEVLIDIVERFAKRSYFNLHRVLRINL